MSSIRSRSGGNSMGDHVKAIIQILTELAVPDSLFQIDAGGGHNADIHLKGCRFRRGAPLDVPAKREEAWIEAPI